jgi:hypothetical protein
MYVAPWRAISCRLLVDDRWSPNPAAGTSPIDRDPMLLRVIRRKAHRSLAPVRLTPSWAASRFPA